LLDKTRLCQPLLRRADDLTAYGVNGNKPTVALLLRLQKSGLLFARRDHLASGRPDNFLRCNMLHTLPNLPYALDALEPYLSRETLEYHYGKHHRAYFDKLNKLIQGTEFEAMPLERIVKESTGAVFNNAAQAWNHGFYWQCLRPAQQSGPAGELQQAIVETFESLQKLQEKFTEKAVEKFGSGWVWLLANNGRLEIETTDDADVPHLFQERAVLLCDVWEHAYYIDYRNERPKYLSGFWQLANWEHATARFTMSRKAA
jgi:superoxide dismutase, Fe-Mn family